MDSRVLVDELAAACNSLGKLDVNDGVYMKDRECKACLKEIIRILNLDNSQRQVRITLGKLNIVAADLIPLIVQYCDFKDGDRDLFKLILKLATNITSSVLILFEEMPTEPDSIKTYNQILEGLYNYKRAFAEEPKIWRALDMYLKNVDDNDSETETETLFERILILIRNILHIPVDDCGNLGVKSSSNSHDLCINHMNRSGMLNTIIKLASETTKGTEFCFHIIEIVYLILREQNPITIASASQPNTLKRKLDDNDHDKKVLADIVAKEKMERDVRERNFRQPRFKYARFTCSNLTGLGDRPLMTKQLVKSREDLHFDGNKTQLRKAKNKKPLPTETNSPFYSDQNLTTSHNSASLKMFSKLFVEKVYANYMQQIKFNLMQKKAAENDETYYLWSIQYFMPFARHLFLDMNHISETISTSSIHFVQMLITDYQDKLKLEKKRSQYEKISQRLHLAVRAYKEILATYQFIKPESGLYAGIEATKKTIFSEIEYNTLLLTLFKQYVSSKHSPGYLRDLIKTNHVYLELIEAYNISLNEPIKTAFFLSSYCIPEILIAYTDVLRDFKTNETSVNLNILKFFERVVHDCKNEVMLMQASLLQCLLQIYDYHSSLPGYHGFVALTKHIMSAFGDMILKKRWMVQELLFWKSRHDVIEIENAIDPPAPVAHSPKQNDLDFELNLTPPQGRENEANNAQSDNEELDKDRPGDSIEDLMAELGSESSFNSDFDENDDDGDDEVLDPAPAADANEQEETVDNDNSEKREKGSTLPQIPPSSDRRDSDSSSNDGDADNDSESGSYDDDDEVSKVEPANKRPHLSVYPSDSDDDLSSPPSPLPSPDPDEAPKLSDVPVINEDSD